MNPFHPPASGPPYAGSHGEDEKVQYAGSREEDERVH
jgi:hypothetical protein